MEPKEPTGYAELVELAKLAEAARSAELAELRSSQRRLGLRSKGNYRALFCRKQPIERLKGNYGPLFCHCRQAFDQLV
ncbi:hypothetical protein [Paenibacillus planticolens]|uniref:Uncharacterized protein n=1 Tax=Paenibacillus planticolens TaxID=2654976 RepID=A0ABX1ZUY3_9BACL|nr:hypothetical protein [Paenibacillus planticolens]NOV02855.1 hypothetical protein [Paenibacillus planticolens]